MSNDLTLELTIPPKVEQLLNGDIFKDVIKGAVKDTTMEAEKIMKSEAPVDTGNLRRSLTPEYNELEGKIKTAGSSPAEYWVYLQYGTSKMAANPFVTRTIEQLQSKQVFERAITKQLKNKGVI